MTRTSSRAVRAAVLDAGSWVGWDTPIDLSQADDDYVRRLRRAAERAGTDESVVTGEGRISGRRIALVVSEFDFMAGSVGIAAADRLCAAIRRATRERLPLLASTASGGTRMSEGTPAFLRMIDVTRAIVDHRAAGLLYLVHLRHPTTGGVLASWGSLGHVSLAEPGALIGLIGPKVFEHLAGRPFPPDVQVAEKLRDHGVIDHVVTPGGLRHVAAALMELLGDRIRPPTFACSQPQRSSGATSVWAAVEATRAPDRISLSDLMARCDDVIRLDGMDAGANTSSVVVAFARMNGMSCVVVGQDRRAQTAGHLLGPAAMRIARRGMTLAQSLGLPLVTVVDTPGAELSAPAENGGLAREVANCLASLSALTVPSVSVLLGQGGGAGALALLAANRTVAAEQSWLAPLPLEGASAIEYGDVTHAPDMARRQHIGVEALRREGRVHVVVPERRGKPVDDLAIAILAAVRSQLDELRSTCARPILDSGR